MFRAFWRRGSVWPWCTLLAVSGLVVAVIAWEVWPRTVDLSLVRPRATRSQAASTPATDSARVRLFFPHEAKSSLVEEERAIPRRAALADRVRAVLQELARAGKGGVAPYPPGATVRDVFLDQFGILYLDFGAGIESLAAGDAGRAALAISAIVLSLATNVSEVKRVQFLRNGHSWAAQVGTVDLRRPLQPSFPEDDSRAVAPASPGPRS